MGNENSSEEPTVRPPGAGHVYQRLVLLGCYTKLLNSADWPYWCYWDEHWINCLSGLNDSLVLVSSDCLYTLCTVLCVEENVCLCLVSNEITGNGYSVTAGAVMFLDGYGLQVFMAFSVALTVVQHAVGCAVLLNWLTMNVSIRKISVNGSNICGGWWRRPCTVGRAIFYSIAYCLESKLCSS